MDAVEDIKTENSRFDNFSSFSARIIVGAVWRHTRVVHISLQE
jgi:hypothetical protein